MKDKVLEILANIRPEFDFSDDVNFIEEESADGIAAALKTVLAETDEELFRKGCAARDFVLDGRNNVVQAEKMLKMFES